MKENNPFSKEFLLEFSERHPKVLRQYKEQAEERLQRGEGVPSDGGIYDKIKTTAHNQSKILIEELQVNIVHGDNFGAVGGKDNAVTIGNVAVYKNAVDNSPNIDPGTRELLKQAIDAIENAEASDTDKDEVKADLLKLTKELEKLQKEPGAIRKYLTRIAAVMPSIATISSSGKALVDVVGTIPIPGSTG